MNKKQKLELTWIGKDEQVKLEPRILIEDPKKSYGDKNAENILIYGDNLLALKALEQDYTGKIKCVYIDPPFNTKQAFEQYDDNKEHSIWLTMMRSRLTALRTLLSESGAMFVHINMEEFAHLKLLLDEVFGRKNFLQIITVKCASTASFRSINLCPVTVTEYILMYAKDRDRYDEPMQYVESNYTEDYGSYIKNKKENHDKWEIIPLDKIIYEKHGFKSWTEAREKWGVRWKEIRFQEKAEIALNEPDSVVSLNTLQKPSKAITAIIKKSKENKGKVFEIAREERDSIYVYNGRTLAFFSKKFRDIDGENKPSEVLTNFWNDISYLSLGLEGGVDFKNGKKPEALLKRILEICTWPGDFVIDSFLGSGSTSAVAHKMNRKWIGIELGDHCYTHCLPRLKKVIDGTDQGGISQAVNWKGGGGFKFYTLAPSLLKKDKYNNWIIDEKYNANMLAAAMAKHEGFKYCPDEQIYWKQGKSTEKDFIYTTTQFVTIEVLDKIKEEMKNGESLLICAKSFQKACENKYEKITVKKIPQMLLGRCEFGKDNYKLNIIDMPEEDGDDE